MPQDSITITSPDDWHLHLRDGDALVTTVAHTARCFRRAIVMPNLKPPVTTVAAALSYRKRILQALPKGQQFEPLMTLYLTDTTEAGEIDRASADPAVIAVKYYPAGATTNSSSGVTVISKVYPVIERMEALGMPLLLHGEVTDNEVDIFDREKVFIERVLAPLLKRFPGLKLVLEHITTADAVDFVTASGANVAATITAHHLLFDRNDLLVGGIRPHYFCLPVLKRGTHREALIAAATSGNSKFFLGTDSAPHTRSSKENNCGCAGIYSAPAAIELYAEVFDKANALDRLEGFASYAGPDFYGLPRNTTKLTLRRNNWTMAADFAFADEVVVPIRAGMSIGWEVAR